MLACVPFISVFGAAALVGPSYLYPKLWPCLALTTASSKLVELWALTKKASWPGNPLMNWAAISPSFLSSRPPLVRIIATNSSSSWPCFHASRRNSTLWACSSADLSAPSYLRLAAASKSPSCPYGRLGGARTCSVQVHSYID